MASTAVLPTRNPLRTPVLLLFLAVCGLLVLLLPVAALTQRVDFTLLPQLLSDPATRSMMRISIFSALWAVFFSLLLGVPLAIWISSLRRGSTIIRLFILLPLALPPVVAGLALTAAVGRRGLLAPALSFLHLDLSFNFSSVVLAHVFIALPFVVVATDSALRQLDKEVIDSARGIGMTPGRIIQKIILPALLPAIATGAGLAFARSLGEFGTTITFAGSLPGATRTMPTGIYLAREISADQAYGLATILIFLALIALVLAALPLLFSRWRTTRSATPATTTGELDIPTLRRLSTPHSSALSATINRYGTNAESITFPAGETTAIVGPNGAGKTTLVGQLSGRLSGAQVLFDGTDVSSVPAHERSCVVLTQNPGLPSTGDVISAVSMATERDTAHDLIKAAGLESLEHTPLKALSGGQAAQVALLRALAARPNILILDEPFSAIDLLTAARWRELLTACSGDRTIIFISHDPLDVALLAQNIAVMESGQVVELAKSNKILTEPPTQFSAEFAGLNRITGIIQSISAETITIETDQGLQLAGTIPPDYSSSPLTETRIGDPAAATWSPENTRIVWDERALDAPNMWRAQIHSITVQGTTTVLKVAINTEILTVPLPTTRAIATNLAPKDSILVTIPSTDIAIHPYDLT